jgi:CheY-like chemotaxis protein
MARFLYIEDQKDLREGAQNEFAEKFPDDEFITAVDYWSAFDALTKKGPFDGIISDVSYPGQDPKETDGGIDLYEFLQNTKNLAPFVVISKTQIYITQSVIPLADDHVFCKIHQTPGDAVAFLKAKYLPQATPKSPAQPTPRRKAKPA